MSSDPPAAALASPTAATLPRHNPLRSQTLIGMATPFAPPAAEPKHDPAQPATRTELAPAAVSAVVGATATATEPAQGSAPIGASAATPDAAFARPALPVVSEAPPSSTTGTETESRASDDELESPTAKRSGAGFGIVLLAAAGLAIGVGGYRFLHHDVRAGLPDLAALPPPPVLNSPAAASPSAVSADTAPTAPPAASATAADFPAAPPAPLDAPADNPKGQAAPSASAALEPAPSGVQRVTVTTVPPKAKFFHYGKEVGTAPFVVDLPAGEKRAYEVWLPGHITRKLLIDGSKSEISLGLREEPAH